MTRREAGLDRKDSTLMNLITHWIMNHSNAKGVRSPPRRHAAKNDLERPRDQRLRPKHLFHSGAKLNVNRDQTGLKPQCPVISGNKTGIQQLHPHLIPTPHFQIN